MGLGADASTQQICIAHLILRQLLYCSRRGKFTHLIHVIAMQMVEQEYEDLYPGQVAAVHLVYDNRPLRKMQGEYASSRQKMLDLVDKYASLRARGKPVSRKTVRGLSSRVVLGSADAIMVAKGMGAKTGSSVSPGLDDFWCDGKGTEQQSSKWQCK